MEEYMPPEILRLILNLIQLILIIMNAKEVQLLYKRIY